MRTKEKFPDEATLKAYNAQHIGEYLAALRVDLGPLEEAYVRANKRSSLSIWCVTLAIFLVTIFLARIGDVRTYEGYVTLGILIIIAVVLFIMGIRFYKGTFEPVRQFTQKYNEVIFPFIFKILEIEGTHVLHTQTKDSTLKQMPTKDFQTLLASIGGMQKFSQEYAEVIQVLKDSELITEEYNATRVDDMFSFMLGAQKLFVSELAVQNVQRSNKGNSVKNIFTGYFATFEINKNLTGKTFVSTEGDTEGFGHQTFWNNLTNSGLGVTQLEWNDFENLLHVATTDPVEARYVLPPDFMQSLYTWWNGKKYNIRISFIQNRMYMLFPSTHVRFGKTVPSLTEDEVLRYIESVSIPLLHILHLADDASRQFNK